MDADAGERLKVRVEFADDAGHAESLTSAATGPVEAAPRPNTLAEGAPTIAGKARVGGTLSASTSGIADADGLADAVFAYQWRRGGADIRGATGSRLHGGGRRRGRTAQGAGRVRGRRRQRRRA